jgi:hypothetical protein
MAWVKLIKALRSAAETLNSRETMRLTEGPYADSQELAAFLAMSAGQVIQGQMAGLPELRRIVAPAGDWDRALGPREIADTIAWWVSGALDQPRLSADAIPVPSEEPSVVKERELEWRICTPYGSESDIRTRLQSALPALRWSEGDSSWDKVRVWGESPDLKVRVYRYESPGPFDLSIWLRTPGRAGAGQEYYAIRGQVLAALKASVWKPLEPQPVSLIKVDGRFPAHYEFECDLSFGEIERLLTDSDFWYWIGYPERYIEARIPFLIAYKTQWNGREGIHIIGNRPHYRMEVGYWKDAPDVTPTCGQVHEIAQTTILPALQARNVRADRKSNG